MPGAPRRRRTSRRSSPAWPGGSYFSDTTMSDWKRVAYVELRAEGSTDPFERVVFPTTPELPDGIMPLLDGTRTLREVVRAVCAVHPVGTQPYSWLAEA